ncbi:DMT family transporter [Novosphingobium sp.]|uniref:DMT family transporter n=1 Tax=Novosphingobium sp. TaxID=1874826 RepID=UPI00333F47BA
MTTASAAQKTASGQTPALSGAAATGGARWFAALLVGCLALAIGPYFVRIADCGPVSAGFWRLVLPLPVLALLARRAHQPLMGHSTRTMAVLVLAGLVFGLDLASWHLGIDRTRLGNATLFGNVGSIFLMLWGLVVARRRPRGNELAAIACALAGAAILLGRSLEIATATLIGDLLCILAGLFYFSYFVCLSGVQRTVGGWPLVFYTGVFAAPVMAACALWMGEPLWPHMWWPVLALALCSQIIGQGLLVAALPRFSPLVIGLALLTQPAVSVVIGLIAFGERPTLPDGIGMVLVAGALVIARVRD